MKERERVLAIIDRQIHAAHEAAWVDNKGAAVCVLTLTCLRAEVCEVEAAVDG